MSTKNPNWQEVAKNKDRHHKRASRQSARIEADKKRISDHDAPKVWVLAHINSRADFAPGYLAELVHDRTNPHQLCNWQQYLTETRRAYKASR